jgi:peptidoglycan hydrolase-like protein with peptidoglycan-binding domain
LMKVGCVYTFAKLGMGILVILAGVMVPGSAHAGPSQGAVDGSLSGLQYDWDDEGEVSRFSHTVSGATGLWQAVLWADGGRESNGTTYDASDIDCQFGPNTEYTTRSWQALMGGLAVDGRAGNNTWSVDP